LNIASTTTTATMSSATTTTTCDYEILHIYTILQKNIL
jgi:hypothetical protein